MKNILDLLEALSNGDKTKLTETLFNMEKEIKEQNTANEAEEALEDIIKIEEEINNCSSLNEAEGILEKLAEHKKKYKNFLEQGKKKIMKENGEDFVRRLQQEDMLLPVIISMLISENGGTLKIPYNKLKEKFVDCSGLAIVPSKEYMEVKTIE